MNKILKDNVNFFGNSLGYLDNQSLLANEYINLISFIRGKNDMVAKNQIKIDILENEIISILEKNPSDYTSNDKVIIEKAKNFYNILFKNIIKNKSDIRYLILFCQSSIFAKDIPGKLFDSKTAQDIQKEKRSVYEQLLRLCDKYINNPTSLDANSIDFIFTFLKKNINNPNIENFNHNVASIIINEDEENLRFSQRLFMIEYLNYWKCKNKKIDLAKIYVTSQDLFDGSSKNNHGSSYGETGIITINKDLVINKKEYNDDVSNKFFINGFEMSIFTTLHELEHYYQSHCKKNNIFSYENFIYSMRKMFDEYLTTKQFDEYLTNYSFIETEREANKKGWREFEIFYSQHNGSNIVRNAANIAYNGQYFGEAFAKKYGLNGKIYERSIYNATMMKNILEQNSDAIQKYPIMKYFLDKNGKFISQEEIIKNLCSLRLKFQNGTNEESKRAYKSESILRKIYSDTLHWYLFTGNGIDYSKLNKQEIKYYYTLVADYYAEECRKVKNKMDYYKNDILRSKISPEVFAKKIKNSLEIFDNETYININRIKKMYNFLMSLPDDITQIAPEINSYGSLNKQNINMELATFRHRIDECGLSESKLANELRELTNMCFKGVIK